MLGLAKAFFLYQEEKRRYERLSLESYLRVFRQDTDELIGHIMDISLGGMMLLNKELPQKLIWKKKLLKKSKNLTNHSFQKVAIFVHQLEK